MRSNFSMRTERGGWGQICIPDVYQATSPQCASHKTSRIRARYHAPPTTPAPRPVWRALPPLELPGTCDIPPCAYGSLIRFPEDKANMSSIPFGERPTLPYAPARKLQSSLAPRRFRGGATLPVAVPVGSSRIPGVRRIPVPVIVVPVTVIARRFDVIGGIGEVARTIRGII